MPKFEIIKGAVIIKGDIVGQGSFFESDLEPRQHLIDAGVIRLAVDAPAAPVAEVKPQEAEDSAPAEPQPEPVKVEVTVAKGLGRPPKQK